MCQTVSKIVYSIVFVQKCTKKKFSYVKESIKVTKKEEEVLQKRNICIYS